MTSSFMFGDESSVLHERVSKHISHLFDVLLRSSISRQNKLFESRPPTALGAHPHGVRSTARWLQGEPNTAIQRRLLQKSGTSGTSGKAHMRAVALTTEAKYAKSSDPSSRILYMAYSWPSPRSHLDWQREYDLNTSAVISSRHQHDS